MKRTLGILVAALFIVPALAFAGVQLYAAVVVGRVAHEVQKSISPERPKKGAFPFQVANTNTRRNHASPGYIALTRYDQLQRSRVVQVSMPVLVKDLLEPGESMPDKDFEAVFVKARAVKLAQTECALLLEQLARECKPDQIYVSESRGRYTVHLTLQYVQKGLFFPALETGTIPGPDVQYSYEELTDKLNLKPQGDHGILGQLPKMRAKFYARAVSLCDRLRAREGSCAIQHLRITVRPDSKSTTWGMKGQVTLAWLEESPAS